MTVSDYIHQETINPRTARRRIAKSGHPFLLKAEATPDIQAILSGQIKVTKIGHNGHDRTCDKDTRTREIRTQDRTEIRTQDTRTKGHADKRTVKARTMDTDKLEQVTVMAGPILITLVSVTLTIAGLYVFANWAGAGLGSMFAVYLFTSVVLARNRMKGDTSQQALSTVLHLEIGAATLHCFTFWRLLPTFPAGNGYMFSRALVCLILAGFIAFLSYRAVQVVRTYNAEVIEPETKPSNQ